MPTNALLQPGVTLPAEDARDRFASYIRSAFPGGKHLMPHLDSGPFYAVSVFCRNEDDMPLHPWEVFMAYPRVRMRVWDWEDDLGHAVVMLVPEFAYEVLAADSLKEGGDYWVGLEPRTFGATSPDPRDIFEHLHVLWNLPHGGCEGLGDDPEDLDLNACELSDCDPALASALETLKARTDLEVFLAWAERSDCWTSSDSDATTRRDLLLAYAAAFSS